MSSPVFLPFMFKAMLKIRLNRILLLMVFTGISQTMTANHNKGQFTLSWANHASNSVIQPILKYQDPIFSIDSITSWSKAINLRKSSNDTIFTDENIPVDIVPTIYAAKKTNENSLMVRIIKHANHGKNYLESSTGTITYIPEKFYYGYDTIIARISENVTPTAFTNDTIFITVHHVNQSPFSLRICDSTAQNKSLEMFPLRQNFDPDKNIDKFSMTLANKPVNGKVKIEKLLGKLIYTPKLNFTGKDSFVIHFCDIGMPVLCAYDTIVITVREMFVSHPAIGVAKSVDVINIHNNRYDIKYTITVKNLGNEDLYYFQVNDNLSKVFKNNFTFNLNGNISSSGDIRTNAQYDGINDTTLLAPDCRLLAGASVYITIPVTAQSKDNSSTVVFNSAYASGIDSTGTIVSDISENGVNPDPNGNGNANEAGENDPTPFSFAPEIFIPDGFSPNNDGINDFFVITCRGNNKISLKVYNRLGNIVYENENYRNNWDGRGNQGAAAGKKLQDGNYFVIVGLNNGKKSSVKTITIHR